MSSALKLCSGSNAVKKFQKAGWTVARQKGSHIMMTKPSYQWTLSIPQHRKLGPGLLSKLINHAGLTTEEFNDL